MAGKKKVEAGRPDLRLTFADRVATVWAASRQASEAVGPGDEMDDADYAAALAAVAQAQATLLVADRLDAVLGELVALRELTRVGDSLHRVANEMKEMRPGIDRIG